MSNASWIPMLVYKQFCNICRNSQCWAFTLCACQIAVRGFPDIALKPPSNKNRSWIEASLKVEKITQVSWLLYTSLLYKTQWNILRDDRKMVCACSISLSIILELSSSLCRQYCYYTNRGGRTIVDNVEIQSGGPHLNHPAWLYTNIVTKSVYCCWSEDSDHPDTT